MGSMVDMPLVSAALRRLCRSEFAVMASTLRRKRGGQVPQVVVELGAEAFVLEAVLDGSLQIAELAAAIVTLAFEFECIHGLVAEQVGDRVGQLDLAAGAAAGVLEFRENGRRQQITSDHCERRRCILRTWLF